MSAPVPIAAAAPLPPTTVMPLLPTVMLKSCVVVPRGARMLVLRAKVPAIGRSNSAR